MEKADVGIPNDEIVNVLQEADVNNDGTICFSEFRALLTGNWYEYQNIKKQFNSIREQD